MRCYQTLRRTPYKELSIAESAVLILERAMLGLREKCNAVRASSWMNSSDADYPYAYFQGTRFSLQSMVFDHEDGSYHEFSELAERYATEADFLAGPYLERKAA